MVGAIVAGKNTSTRVFDKLKVVGIEVKVQLAGISALLTH
jgi:hypothetical protein